MSDNREMKLRTEVQANQLVLSRAQAELNRINQMNSIMAAKIAAKKQEMEDLRDEASRFRESNPPASGPSAKSPNKK